MYSCVCFCLFHICSGNRIVDTIADIEEGNMSVDDLPPITVVIGGGGHKFSLDNRRLYVLKELRKKGLLPKNKVTVLMRKAPPRDMIKYTTDKCSLNGTIMREKAGYEVDDMLSVADGSDIGDHDSISQEISTDICERREKNDKKKNKPGGDQKESDEERFLRQKRIIAEKQLEFQKQAAERQRQRQLEKVASSQRNQLVESRMMGSVHVGESDGDSDSDSDAESIEEVFVCALCRKEFKSEQQVEQHFITKSHKNKVKDAKKKKGGKIVGGEDEIKIVSRPKKRKKPSAVRQPPSPKNELLEGGAEVDVDVIAESGGSTGKGSGVQEDKFVVGESVDDSDLRPSTESGTENEDKIEDLDVGQGSDDDSDEGGGNGRLDGDSVHDCSDEEESSTSSTVAVVRKSDPVNDALMLLLIQKRISQLEVAKEATLYREEAESEMNAVDKDVNHKETRVTTGSEESRNLIAELEKQKSEARYNQQLTKSFQHEGVGSKALPSQYVHKQGAAFDSRMAENRHHRGSHYVMAGGVQFQRGVRVKGVVSRHSKQAAVRNGPVGGGAQNMKRMGLLNEQRETGKKGSGSSSGKKSGKKKCRKNPSDT
mmetsp:Transcript_230/g.471  ORF Transcript_230/g.471 Transcript_230/m.471 type:complete len:598 (-) Transcript_230:2758-4551(-)